MAVFKCKMCGADLNESAENNIYECEYCGTRQTVTVESGLEAVIFSLLSRAKSYLMKGNFEKANEYFDKVLDFAPENEEALLGKLLIEFNAKSIEDLVKNTVIFIFSENYKLLIECCSLEMKQNLDTAFQSVKKNFEIALDALVKEGNAPVAREICKRILLIDSENKKALLYMLLTTYFVTSIEDLAKGITTFTSSDEFKAVCKHCDEDVIKSLDDASEQIRQNILLEMEESLKKGRYDSVRRFAYSYLSCYPSNDELLLYKFLADINERSLEEAEKHLNEFYNRPEYSHITKNGSRKLSQEIQEVAERIKIKVAQKRRKEQIIKTITATVIIAIITLIITVSSIISNRPMSIYEYSTYNNEVRITGINKPDKAVKDGHLDIPEKICGKNVYYVSGIKSQQISSVTIPDTVTIIGENAFSGCSNLKEVIIPNSVKKIQAYAFSRCTALKKVTFTNSLAEIGESAFSECTALEKIIIPKSVTKIDNHAFKDCKNLMIYCQVSEKPDDWAFSWNTDFRPVFWGTEDYGETENGLAWYKKQDNTITIQKYNGSQVNVVIPSVINGYTVTRIDDNAFFDKIDVISIEIPNTVETIGASAFSGCKRLKSIKLPQNLKYVETKLFLDCRELETAELPYGIVEIKEKAFSGCSSLTTINIPTSVTTIGTSVFASCKSLSSISVPNSVIYIGSYAFSYCESLSYFKVPNAVTAIYEYTFNGCTSLNAINISNSVTSIGEYAFYGCSKIASITIPSNVTSIGEYAFRNCSSLTYVVIPISVTYIGNYAFFSDSYPTIFCEAQSQPIRWAAGWNYNCPVVWGYEK